MKKIIKKKVGHERFGGGAHSVEECCITHDSLRFQCHCKNVHKVESKTVHKNVKGVLHIPCGKCIPHNMSQGLTCVCRETHTIIPSSFPKLKVKEDEKLDLSDGLGG